MPVCLPSVSISVSDSTALETENLFDTAEMTVTRSGATTDPLEVYFSTGGSATASDDHNLGAFESVTIPAGSSSATIEIIATDDTENEGDETFVVTLASSPLYEAASGSLQATVTIDDDDDLMLPTVSIVASDPDADEQGTATGEFTISLDAPAVEDVTVSYYLYGDAYVTSDYATLSGEVTILEGQDTATITITPIDDSEAEAAETVIAELVPLPEYYVDEFAFSDTVTIADNDLPTVSLTASDADAAEEATDPGEFTVTRDGPTDAALTISFGIAGTADNGVDYVTVATTVEIPIGSSTATVAVTPIDDSETEATETVELTLLASGSYIIDVEATQATVSITDNDAQTLLLATRGPTQVRNAETVSPLSDDVLSFFVEQGIEAWAAAGIAPADLDALREVPTRVADLPGNALGASTFSEIIVDVDAAGVGWYTSVEWPSSDDAVDLLTVVTHELGHHLGFPDHRQYGFDDIMAGTLTAGTRRLPAPGHLPQQRDALEGLFHEAAVNAFVETGIPPFHRTVRKRRIGRGSSRSAFGSRPIDLAMSEIGGGASGARMFPPVRSMRRQQRAIDLFTGVARIDRESRRSADEGAYIGLVLEDEWFVDGLGKSLVTSFLRHRRRSGDGFGA